MTRLAMAEGQAVQVIRPGLTQKVAYTGTAAPMSNAFGANTTVARIVCTSNAYYSYVSDTGAATTSDVYLPLGVVEYVSVRPGEKLSFIQDSANGNAFVSEGK